MKLYHKIIVDLDDRSYPILIGNKILDGNFNLAKFITGPDCLVVSNETIAPFHMKLLLSNLIDKKVSTIELMDGEAYKNIESTRLILDKLVSSNANRDTTVIALGGGVVGDITGFAAACYMRGVSFIQVPTTLLAQVDSSVGGKTGVNHPEGKNLIGAFHQPKVVLIDTNTLRTLPDREYRAGLAEVIKHAVICDMAYFEWLEENIQLLISKDPEALAHTIRRSCEIKAAVVAEDEYEADRRATLNFGHTFGHAIEHCLGYGEWLHGEAVAVGMIMAAKLSDIETDEVARLENLIRAAGLPVDKPKISFDDWFKAIGMDKKIQQKQLRFVLLERLGKSFVTSSFDKNRLLNILGDDD
ncbi:MAG: 3-dehydroquinate synthase [Gammaproteobacteria bacterium]|nr:3-dehydroquinate synthase [Gammaproteobacteria bacterium]|tara:strand:- start:1589 stop:2659 length:1071 start_codon:yes stop_codon:yes gene_type:complete